MFKPTIKKLLKKPSLDIELLLAHSIKKDRVFVLTHGEYQLDLFQYWYFIYNLFLLKRGFSVAAITHQKEFFGLNFYVDKNVLVPRPETELIVEEVLKYITENDLLIDVGTGSGCIPISILKNTTTHKTIALDISNKALKVAKKNCRHHNVQIEFLKSNLLKKIFSRDFKPYKQIIITANLPYLTKHQVDTELSIQREPKLALIAKENGLALYRKLLEQITKIFADKKLLILLEIDPTQNQEISKLAQKYFSHSQLEIKKDLAGLDRILKIST